MQLVPSIATLAGNGTAGYSGDGSAAPGAELNSPFGVAMDIAGNVYIADFSNNCIREVIAATGNIETIAGNGVPGYTGDGNAAIGAELNGPYGVAVDKAGNVYIADTGNQRIREVVLATGNIVTIAGNGTPGYNGDGIAAIGAELNGPYGVAVDSAGNLYIADTGNQRVREVVMATGNIGTVAGNGTSGYNGDGIAATGAELNSPRGVAVDSSGNVYIADYNNQRTREVVAATAKIQTVAGNGTSGYNGDGIAATSAELNFPFAVAVDGAGNVYIADTGNQRNREVVSATGKIETVAGTGSLGYSGDGGVATGAKLNGPGGVAVDNAGDAIVVADTNNQRVREVATYTSFPATALGFSSAWQNVNIELISAQPVSNIAVAASLSGAQEYTLEAINGCTVDGVTVNSAGTICTVSIAFTPVWPGVRGVPLMVQAGSGSYITGLTGNGIGPLSALLPGIIGTAAGNGTYGFGGDGDAATSAELSYPESLAVDSASNVYAVDYANNRIREVVATTGQMQTIAGDGTYGYSGDGEAAVNASLNSPSGVAVDSAGNVYIADTYNQRIREVVAESGAIETVAGNGTSGFNGDGAAATSAELNSPSGVAVDSTGNIYIADTGNQRIREVIAATGKIVTIAGNGTGGYNGDGIASTSAKLNNPYGVAVDGAGNIYVADTSNQRIREVLVGTSIIQTIAGNGTSGYSGDGVAATGAELNQPHGVTVDSAGNVYIADSANQRIREVLAGTGTIETAAGNGTVGYSGDNGTATSAELNHPYGVAVDSAGSFYVADTLNSVVRSIHVILSTLNFANTPGGQTSTDSPQTVTVVNSGNALLNITGVSFADDFPEALDAVTDCTDTTTLASGNVCTLSIDFSPLLANMTDFSTPFNELVSLTTNDLNGTDVAQAIFANGTGTLNPATLTSPAPSTVLAGPTVTFTWSTATGATGYGLWLGTTAGGNDLYTFGTPAATSTTVHNLPTNGATIYARLFTYVDFSPAYFDYVFTAATAAALTSPSASTVLAGTTIKFTWSAATGSSGYSFRLGTTQGANNLYASGLTATTFTTVANLPTNGETIYARLYTYFGSSPAYTDYVFTAATAAVLTSPAPTTVFASPVVSFTWSAGAPNASYSFRLGTTQGANNLYASGLTTATSITAINLPSNGATIYGRLYTYYASSQVYADYVFTATTANVATLTSPAPSTGLAGPQVTFTWSAAAGSTGYSFRLGTTKGANNLYASGLTTATSVTPTNLPTNGETIYARLYTYYASSQAYADYVFTAAP